MILLPLALLAIAQTKSAFKIDSVEQVISEGKPVVRVRYHEVGGRSISASVQYEGAFSAAGHVKHPPFIILKLRIDEVAACVLNLKPKGQNPTAMVCIIREGFTSIHDLSRIGRRTRVGKLDSLACTGQLESGELALTLKTISGGKSKVENVRFPLRYLLALDEQSLKADH